MNILHNELGYADRVLCDLKASLITLDLQGYITGWNEGAASLFGYSTQEVLGKHILVLYADEHEDDADLFNTVLTHGRGEMEVKRRKKNGEVFWASLYFSLARDAQGKPARMVGFIREITDRLESEESARLYTRIFDSANDAIIITNPQRQIIRINTAYSRITGYNAEESRGNLPGFLSNEDTQRSKIHHIDATLTATGHWEGELWDKRKNGEAFPAWVILSAVRDEAGHVLYYFGVCSDLTERKKAEAQIHRLAYYDPLTNLPNRAMLFALLGQALAESRRNNRHGAVLCFNIAGFKHINDSFGHHAADCMLVELAQRLQESLREADIVARSGADEFFIGLFDIQEREDVMLVIQRVMSTVKQPFMVKQQEVLLSAHIGAAIFPDDGKDPEDIINKATVALYRARENDQDALFYSCEMNRRSLARITLETELRHAIERDELLLHYQPQIDQSHSRLIGAEALIRWQHPTRGLVPPSEFIPFAEESGLILSIGEWVAGEAIRQIGEWQRQDIKLPMMSINLSARQFRTGLVERLQSMCSQHQVKAEQIELEITETLLMNGNVQVTELLHTLHEAGFALALDDFGTGYSNLAYLHRFPFDTIKIDRAFVTGLPENRGNVALTRAIIGIAQSLGLEPIAEGVETPQEAQFLHDSGCARYQGYLCSRPLPAAEFALLAQRLASH